MAKSEAEDDAPTAASVFRDVLLGEIGEENARFREEIPQLWPVLSHVQRVELVAAVNEAPLESLSARIERPDGSVGQPPAPPPRFEAVATASLSQGRRMTVGGSEKLTIPVVASHDVLVANLTFMGGIGVSLARREIGLFPISFHGAPNGLMNMADATSVVIAEDNTATLTISISRFVCIKGVLNFMSDEDILAFKERPVNEHGYAKDIFSLSPGTNGQHPTFTPTSIVMDTSLLQNDLLRDIEEATAPHENSWEPGDGSPADELRGRAIAALGKGAHKLLLCENRTLRRRHRALANIRETAMRAGIGHDSGAVAFSLDEGEWDTDEDGDRKWFINLAEKDHAVPVHSIWKSTFSVSGVASMAFQERPIFVGPENFSQAGMCIPYIPGVEVVGYFNWAEQSEADVNSITNDFLMRVQSSLSSSLFVRDADGNRVQSFPDSFRLKLLSVSFSRHLIGHVLKLLGLSDESSSDISDDSTQ